MINWTTRDWEDDDIYVSTSEFRRRIGWSRTTIYRHIAQKKIPFKKFEGIIVINWSAFCRLIKQDDDR